MFSWSAKRRLLYLGILFGILAVILSFPIYSWLDRPESCFDNRKNQDELEVDCGGVCSKLCASQVADLSVLWSRALKVSDGLYDAVALVENPNAHGGVRSMSYTFTVFDSKGIILTERTGETFVNPSDTFLIFEGHIRTCLLYTSPSPRDQRGSRMPSSA